METSYVQGILPLISNIVSLQIRLQVDNNTAKYLI